MALTLILAGIFLALLVVVDLRKFWLYALLTALACVVVAIELLIDLDGLTLVFLSAATLVTLPSIGIKLFDIVGCVAITLPCIFWLSTQEFVDGFAYSYALVGAGVAIASRLLFDKKKRQTLCALVLLTSLIVVYISGINISVAEITLAFLSAIILTQNYTRSIDLMTIAS